MEYSKSSKHIAFDMNEFFIVKYHTTKKTDHEFDPYCNPNLCLSDELGGCTDKDCERPHVYIVAKRSEELKEIFKEYYNTI